MDTVVNIARLSGTVESAKGKSFTLKTVETGGRGGDQTFEELHHIRAPKTKMVEKGDIITVIGKLKNRDDDTVVMASTLEQTPDAPSVNQVKVVGVAHQTFDYFPKSGTKRGFGNLLVRLGDGAERLFIQGVCFAQHAFHMQKATRGSIVQVVGRLRRRPYEDSTGAEREAVEIIADRDHTKVLKAASMEDPFADLPDAATPDVLTDAEKAEDDIPFG